jgi:TetR/AcrR family transcriptional regulator, transcriptional repressor for nem operon
MSLDMRYHTDHKERIRGQILAEAANAIRSKGPERVSVAEIMGNLGLTHGGFYAHFKSKDDLVAQAIGCMFDQMYARFQRKTVDRDAREGLAAFIDMYLSPKHRDAPALGCPLAALSGELPRMSQPARVRITEGIDRLAMGMTKLLEALHVANATDLAYSAISEMTGALTLSRSTSDSERSHEILRASRDMLKQRLGVTLSK